MSAERLYGRPDAEHVYSGLDDAVEAYIDDLHILDAPIVREFHEWTMAGEHVATHRVRVSRVWRAGAQHPNDVKWEVIE